MCAAFGQENMTAHRGWRLLSKKLSAKGFHVLRFDYPGTGDSGGSEEEPGRLTAWRAGIVAAVDYLRSVSSAEEVILVGLRLGGTLALLTAEDHHHVCGVAALAPIGSGRVYLRELRFRANAWQEAHLIKADPKAFPGLDVLGDRIGHDTVMELSHINLRELDISLKPILLMGCSDHVLSPTALDRLQRQGCDLTITDFRGYMDYLEDSVASVIPETEFDLVVNWCSQFISTSPASGRSFQAAETESPSRQDGGSLYLFDAVETAARFGMAWHLFGVLCRPTGVRDEGARPVIMINTGFGRHTGDGRVFTTLARRLAAAGTTSLRMDLSGFGDSEATGDDDPNPYAIGNHKDVKEAVDYLERIGYSRPIVVGICSGAFTAFNAAIEDPRIYGIVLVNTQTFLSKQGLSLKVQNRRQRRPFGFYLRAATRPSAWRRLVHGEVAVGAILIALCRRPLAAVNLVLCLKLEKLTGWQTRAGQVSRLFHILAVRRVQVNLIYSKGDPGLTELALWFGRNGRRLRHFGSVQLDVLDKADHALLDYTARLKFIEIVLDLLKRQDIVGTAGTHVLSMTEAKLMEASED